MVRFVFKKLVRDKTIERHKKFGISPTYHTIQGPELTQALKDKLIEEAHEVAQEENKQEIITEFADLYEVIEALCAQYGITEREIKDMQQKTRQERGAFKKGIYIEAVEMADDNEWADYFRAAPDKYREVK